MRTLPIVALLAAMTGPVVAVQAGTTESCTYRAVRQIDFRGPASKDRLIVTIGAGPCSLARLRMQIRSAAGSLLYDFNNTVASMLLDAQEDEPLPLRAKSLAAELVQTGMTQSSEQLPLEEMKSGPAADLYSIRVSEADYSNHLRSGRAVFRHPTYYEGGITIVYDPKRNSARVLYAWGA